MREKEKNCGDNISCILVGNKTDKVDQRQVSIDEAQEMADHYCVRYVETSAKDTHNVEAAFTMMTREVKNRISFLQPKKSQPNVKVDLSSRKLEGK